MQDLRNNDWILGLNDQIYSATPLVTPNQLSLKLNNVHTVHNQINATMDAFHQVQRGVLLQDVNMAPLAQRRKKKRSSESTSTRSSSSDSIMSQQSLGSITPTKSLTPSPMRASPCRNSSNNSQSSTTSTGFIPLQKKLQATKTQSQLESSGYFSFKESRIKALLPTTSTTFTSQGDTVQSMSRVDSSTITTGAKRKLDTMLEVDSIEEQEAEDDCVIIGEAGPSSKSRTPSDALNNNGNATKRPRSDTIVID